ncbi:MAG: hypothetical protein LBV41_04120 [Cytophagaceae bacterium]|jgi:tetratricopeptide (TPR) repeat protein|nr:hypothetical protein [Cytophagaceae bacterium]
MRYNRKSLQSLLDTLSLEELKKHILSYSEKEERFIESFINEISEPEAKSYKEYLEKVKHCFTEPLRCYNHRGYYSEELSIAQMLAKCFVGINDYLRESKYRDAVRKLLAIVETTGDLYENYIDVEGYIAAECHKAINLLKDIFKNEKNCPHEVKTEAHKRLENLMHNSCYEDFDLGDPENILLFLSVQLASIEDGLKLLDERIVSSEGWKKTEHILSKTNLLKEAGMYNELDDFIEKNIDIHEVRKYKLGMLIDEGKVDETIEYIQGGLKLAEQEHSKKNEIEWKDLLLDVYMEQNRVPNILELSEDLFYNGYDPKRYFPVLKRYTPEKEWNKTFRRLLKSLDESGRHGGINSIKVWIFIREKMWHDLMEMVIKEDIETIFKYEKVLKQHYAEKLLEILIVKIKDYVSKSKSITEYRYTAKVLEKMRSYPQGDKAVDDLIIEFHIRYAKQKELLEMIKGI